MNSIRVICNTSLIIGLLSINKLNLLNELFGEIIIPEAVYEELCANQSSHFEEIEQIKNYVANNQLQVYHIKNSEIVKNLYGKLHFGELEVIVGAKELGIKLAIIDEKAARKMAAEFLIDTIGILGILLLAKKKKILKQIKPEVNKLRENGYRISDKLYKDILMRADEL